MAEYVGTASDETITGGAGDDEIYGADGADTLSGGDGADLIYSRAPGAYDIYDNAKDVLHGDAGDDTLVGGYGDDLDGGTGTDTFVLDLLYSSGGVTADFSSLWNSGSVVVADGTLQNLEKYQSLLLSSGNDTVSVGDIVHAAEMGSAGRQATDYGFGVFASDGDDAISAFATNAGGKLFVDGGSGRDRLVADFSNVTYSVQTIGLTGTLASGYTGRFYTPGSGTGTPEREPGIGFTGMEDFTVIGGSGDDVIVTGAGADRLFGGAGDDYLDAGDGDDVLVGGAGWNNLRGGNGTDTVDYSNETHGYGVDLASQVGGERLTAEESLHRSASHDGLYSIENVIGTDFDDRINGNYLPNRIEAGDGNDLVTSLADGDWLDGGSGTDTVAFTYAQRVRVDLSLGTTLSGTFYVNGEAVGYGGSTVTLGFENVYGSNGADIIWGDGGANELYGQWGADLLSGFGGADLLNGGDGEDAVDYSGEAGGHGVWADLAAGFAFDTYGDADTFVLIEDLFGSQNDDILRGNSARNLIGGAAGADLLSGFGGNDVLRGDGGEDAADYSGETGGQGIHVDLAAGTAIDTYGANDTLATIEDIFGSQWDDVISGDRGPNILGGDAGDDILTGAGGADVLRGQAGADTFVYLDVADSAPGQGDVISDFSSAEGDKVDLRAVDANANVDGAQTFTFVSQFSGTAGELAITGGAGGEWHVVADVNGDSVADLDITVLATGSFGASDLFF